MEPIAMHCTLEQFKSIEDILISNNCRIKCCNNFIKYPYLVNNYNGNFGEIQNLDGHRCSERRREVFEVWDMNKFLEYCDIQIGSIKPNKVGEPIKPNNKAGKSISFDSIEPIIVRCNQKYNPISMK